MLRELRSLTNDFLPPKDSSPKWSLLYRGLRSFDTELALHIHIENEVLFPRVMQDWGIPLD